MIKEYVKEYIHKFLEVPILVKTDEFIIQSIQKNPYIFQKKEKILSKYQKP